jgi:hypothetical protein
MEESEHREFDASAVSRLLEAASGPHQADALYNAVLRLAAMPVDD